MTVTDADLSFGTLLQSLRRRRRLTQQGLAQALGVHRRTLVRWEQGDYLPESKALVLDLARVLSLDEQETRQLLEASLTALTPHWSVPYPRNPYFTGREEILEALHARLGVEQAVALTHSAALHGLGGVGKTQIALEYAYRYALDYRAVFWIEAETEEQIVASLLRIADVLHLPGREDKDVSRRVATVQHWFSTHGQWLLIWDNVEEMGLLQRFLPSTPSGAMLLTTRCQTLGTLARGLDLSPMQQEEGMLFLLRRAKLLSPEAESQQMRQLIGQMPHTGVAAAELVTAMGGLPLALDQAGAYIEETQCTLSTYLDLFCTRRADLLQQRGAGSHAHPASVSTTLRLSIAATAERHPAIWDLLRVCALLQPDVIPEELFRQGARYLGAQLEAIGRDELAWNQVVGVASSYSLLSRQPEERTLSMHRLVQAVLLDTLTQAEREHWTRHVMMALDAVFPDIRPATEYPTWKQGERLLPHALLCVQRAAAQEASLPLASLVYKTAQYLRERGRYGEAEPLYQRALRIQEHTLGQNHPEVAQTLNYLAALYRDQGQYAQAEPLHVRALSIREQMLGPVHPEVASALNNLAIVYWMQGQYVQAEPLYLRALHIHEQVQGSTHPDVASSLNNLALLYGEQGRYAEAEALYRRALHIWEQTLGPDHPHVAQALRNLAELAREQDRDTQAEALYQRARHIWEQALGSDHPYVALALHGQAVLSVKQGNDARAEELFQRVLAIREQHLGPDHPETAHTLHDLARFRMAQGHRNEAIALAERALQIYTQALGKAHPKTVATRSLSTQLVQEQEPGVDLTLEHLRTLLKARSWSVHLKKRRDKPYVYATRKVGTHVQSRYLAPLSNLTACLAAAQTLPNAREEEKPTVAQ